MRRYLPLVFALAACFALGCEVFGPSQQQAQVAGPQAPRFATIPQRGVLPADEFEGWEQDVPDNRVENYGRENLYLYLHEKADLYNDYGFLTLYHGTYRPNLTSKPAVVVDAYKMDMPVNAYGIYTRERNREDKLIAVGGACSLGEKEALFWKGDYFVRITLIDTVDDAEKMLTLFAEKTAANITGPTTLPELEAFPAENRVAAGDSYYENHLLGYDFMGRGFLVEYDLAGKKAAMFLAEESVTPITGAGGISVTPASESYLKLRRVLMTDGSVGQILPGPWSAAYHATHPKLGRGLVAIKGSKIAGIFGVEDDKLAEEMVAKLVSQIR